MEGALTVISDGETPTLHRKLVSTNSSQHANSAPNHSPGVPEESHTVTCSKSSDSLPSADSIITGNVNSPHSSSKVPKLAQNLCYDRSSDGVATNGVSISDPPLQKQEASLHDRMSAYSAGLPCAICSKRFGDAITLQQHWLSHVSDRPHICKICDAAFTTAEALETHKLTHPKIHGNA